MTQPATDALALIDLLHLLDPELQPEQTKIHLASHNGREDPIDEYLAGTFEEWQRLQAKKNFERPRVVSLIALPGRDAWLYAGAYDSHGCRPYLFMERDIVRYDLTERPGSRWLKGRLVVSFKRTGRQSYLVAENWASQLLVSEITRLPLTIGEFPGFKDVCLPMRDLRLLVQQAIESWRAALASVAGVYLISDAKTGRLYVGSADGEGGIWQRWCEYVRTGHGGNVELRALLRDEGTARADHFQFSVLEIADTHASKEQVLAREQHWKRVLLTLDHGLNAN